jgi:hypothetical protein
MDVAIDPLGRTVQLTEEPSRWLKVVVAFDEDSVGSILTAFPRRNKP